MSDGWHIRRGVSGDLAGDIPVFAVALILFGGVVATVVHLIVDHLLRRRS